MNKKQLNYEYTGDLKYQPQPPENSDLQRRCPYIPDEQLVQAVNLAICLERPLLLQGEPGCGKTLLAQGIAEEFGQKGKLHQDYPNFPHYPFFPWYIKSTSRAKEGLYIYDTVARLRDAQLVGTETYKNYLTEPEIKQLFERLKNREKYIIWGELGKAFREETYRPIILIDEIDKADIDFPNDLLRELEEKKFLVTETGETIEAKQPPIVLITSNSEKDLPDAFLRRCIFYYLTFPNREALIKIVQAHFPSEALSQELIQAAVEKFIELRETGIGRPDGKKASTSELLDLIKWLQRYQQTSNKDPKKIIDELAENLPLLGALLKTKDDQDRYRQVKNRET